MEANRFLLDEEEEMVIMREGKQPFSSPPCSSSSSHHYHQYHNDSHHQQPPPTEEKGRRDVALTVEREHMFDKVVTPSDVGKLNRLVIPKQHAERYFPLDSEAQEKSLLLCFEDSSGKPWHFRYSYWNSSQSYVMTKGWSRFVKDKKLDAGDVVSFHRARDKLFIGWRRRLDHPLPPLYHHYQYLSPAPTILPRDSLIYWPNPLSEYPNSGPVIYMRQAAMGPQGGRSSSAVMDPRVYESVPVVQAAAAHKRLRLFGVNMDICPITSNSTNVSDAAAPNCNPHAQFLYPFQLTMYNGAPASSSTSSSLVKEGKSSSSSMSLDLEFSEDI